MKQTALFDNIEMFPVITNIKLSLFQRTTCIKAQKWPPAKLTHIVMNNSCVVPLTKTGMENGDRHYIWGQNGVKGYDP